MEIWGHISFILPTFVAIYLFGVRVKKKPCFYLRYLLSTVLTRILVPLAMDYTVSWVESQYGQSLILLFTRVSFAFSVFILGFISVLISYECDIFVALYLTVSGYLRQHLSRVLVNILILFFPQGGFLLEVLGLGFFWLSIYGGTYLFYIRPRKKKPVIVDNRRQIVVTSIPILFTIVLNSLGGYYIKDKTATVIFDSFVAITAFLGIRLEQIRTKGKSAEIEKATLEKRREESKKQFVFEKQLINLINIKAHDLKHQIGRVEDKSGETKDLSDLVNQYDCTFNTGSKPLDIVLTKKSMESRENGITRTCRANGKALRKFEDSHIFSLFGNILDNAIETVSKIGKKEQRIITLTVKQEGSFVLIHESNYFENDIIRKDGLPLTTKGNNDYHGFGRKSIKNFCDSHNGIRTLNAKDHIFSLDIRLP